MYCIHCGRPRLQGAAFCTNCGRPFSPYGPPSNPGSLRAGRLPAVPWRGGQVALGILLIVLSIVPTYFVAVGLRNLLDGRLVDGHDEAIEIWAISHIMGLAILTVVWILGLRRYGVTLSSLGLGPPRLARIHWMMITLGVLAASLAATALYSAIVRLAEADVLLPPDIRPEISFPGPAVVATFQALAVWTPLTEEIFFRGFIFAGLAPRLGVWRAMLVSALIFSLFHLDPAVMVPIFITGFLLAWLYRQTGSIWPSIMAHGGQNALAVLATIYGV